MKYTDPVLEIVLLDKCDIVTVSNTPGGGEDELPIVRPHSDGDHF